jgi:hypothetical protein
METSVSTIVRWLTAPISYGLSLHHPKVSTSSPSWPVSEQRLRIAYDILARDELTFLRNRNDDSVNAKITQGVDLFSDSS